MIAHGASARLARLELQFRSERRRLFGPVVSPLDGWDIILLLYIADADGRRLTAHDVIAEIGGETEAGKRRIAYLSHRGIVVGDGTGRSDDVVTLAPETITQVEELIDRAWEQIGAE